MQLDGVLALYPDGTPFTAAYGYWDSQTPNNGANVTLHLEDDGFLYLSKPPGVYLKNFTSQGLPKEDMIYRATIDPDGLFRLYSFNISRKDDWSVVWSATNDGCRPKGICGHNMFCMNMDRNLQCLCLPGFAPVKANNGTAGCQRNFTAESCERMNSTTRYLMQPVPNTIWEDSPYSTLAWLTSEKCVEACRQDCNCEAVTYDGQFCNKQRLPLRFGRRVIGGDPNSLFYVKVGDALSGEDGKSGFVQKDKHTRRDILIAVASSIAFAIVMLAVSGFIVSKYLARAGGMLSEEGNTRMMDNDWPRLYTYEELKKVTKDFDEQIGKGAFGTVYKGTLSNGLGVVAVKKLEKMASDGDSEFQTKVKIIGRTHHRDLVKLLGCCLDGDHRLLVYEYMSNGSLADLLFAPERRLCGDEKMGIAQNIARGLLYLHEECETQIIHGDIKPQNILIDEHMHAKISDFGLSKLLKPDQTNTMTRIRGTRGYVAPEWHKNMPVTVKADVYNFGIMLLEIIGCRRSVDWKLPDEEAVLEVWVYNCFRAGELEKLVDDEFMDLKQLDRMVKVGLWCILEEPSLRPSMKKVLLMLEGTVDIPIPPCPSSILSAI